MSSIQAVILAGGQSRRMGRDKSLIPWDGVPMLRRVYDTATVLVPDTTIVTPWSDRYRSILPPDCHWLEDRQPGEGPMVALQQALTQLQADWLWLLGCDLPQLQPEILRCWIAQLDELPETCLVSVPRTPGGWEPLCGFYRPAVLPHLEAFINQGGRSFQNWLDDVPHHTITVGDDEAQILYNCNTLEDLTEQA